ncbi:MAG: E3 binding domain-containing protein, partial [Betaproteobacteria bacterium]|nr:E3 binding domain-containing protein [Betaproteobacteria bacterium]
MSSLLEVKVPDIGDFKDIGVIEVLVQPGETVTKEQTLVTLESDKATMEIPSPADGVVKELRLRVGDRVSQGSPILALNVDAATPAAGAEAKRAPRVAAPVAEKVPARAAAPAPAPALGRPVPREPREELLSKPHASPSIRQFARELGVDLAQVRGSGPKGRIVQEDVQAFVKTALAGSVPEVVAKTGGALPFSLPAWPEADFA